MTKNRKVEVAFLRKYGGVLVPRVKKKKTALRRTYKVLCTIYYLLRRR